MIRALWPLLLLLAAQVPLSAQTVTWVDLSGDWKVQSGDDLRYSTPRYDDSAWRTIRLPLTDPFAFRRMLSGSEYGWLRRAVRLSGPMNRPLTLSLGTIAEAYEVWVNGEQIGRSAEFRLGDLQITRPRSFPLTPSLVRDPMVIAIRVWQWRQQTWLPSLGAWTDSIAGPWQLTDPVAAPRDEDRHAIAAQRLSNSLDAMQGPILLCFAAFALLNWLRARRQMDLFWLGMLLVVHAWMRLETHWQIALDTRPYQNLWRVPLIGALLPATLLALFAAETFAVRRIAWLVWMVTGLGVAALALSKEGAPFYWSMWALELITLITLAAAGLGRDASGSSLWRGWNRWLVMAGIVVILFFHGQRWANWGVRPQWTVARIGDYTLSIPPTAVTLLSLGFTLALTRRLLKDRDERLRLGNELAAARIVQNLLLDSDPKGTGMHEVAAAYQPAQEVGGDFYQVLPLADGALLVAVGDVSGKGLRAAMVVSMVVGVLRSHRLLAPGRLLEALNESLLGSLEGGFVTCLVTRFAPDGVVTIANAGHPVPYRDGQELEDLPAGLPLGIARGVEYPESVLPAGMLTLLSDGVLEAANEQGELFGFERTRAISSKTAKEIAEAAQAWGQDDDITVVTVRSTE